MRKRTAGMLLFAGAAAGGAALGFLAERRTVDVAGEDVDPEWAALRRSPPGDQITVRSADGTGLAVRVAGPPGAPAVVLAHSYAMTSAVWLYQLRDLSDEFRVLAYDLRGHGGSDPAAGREYSTRALAQDLEAVIDAAGGPVVVAGHSMGGMAIMAYAQERPEQVRRCVAGAVLVNTASSRIVWRGLLSAGAATFGTVEQVVRRRRRGGEAPALPGPRASDLTYRLTRALALGDEASPAHAAFVEEQLVGSRTDVLAAFARTLGSLDLDEALEHLDVPAVVIAGDSDRLTPMRQARDLAAALPDARLVQLPGVGHFAPLEAPDAVTAELREHARRLLGRRGARRLSRRGW